MKHKNIWFCYYHDNRLQHMMAQYK